MRTEGEATELAAAHSRRLGLMDERPWRGHRFDGGWLMTPVGADVERRPGTWALVVLDDGRILVEDAAPAPEEILARYRTGDIPGDRAAPPVAEAVAAASATAYAARHLPDLGPRTWWGERFDGGWRLVPQGDDLRWRFDLPGVVVFDDGRVFGASASLPAMVLIASFQELLAVEAAQRASMGRHDGP